ncbi:hypothetical protein DL93DRAFT_2149123 [Clavulina sp. PMI_390]|nr:hypothetical protein DL93DRAFT_2149123 [Clavulina sp. PMI_390]
MSNNTPDCQIPSNPDVSGIGIRVGIYVTTCLTAFLPRNPAKAGLEKLHKDLTQGAGINGLALLLTAVIQTGQHLPKSRCIPGLGHLDLYHAIIIFHQLLFLGVITITSGSYRTSRLRSTYFIITMWAAAALMAAWSIIPSHDPHCNDLVKYVVFFANVRATVPWLRGLAVTGLALGAIGVLLSGVAILTLDVGSAVSDPSKIVRSSGILVWIYNVVMLELTIKRNNVAPGENIWSFGQIVPMVIAVSGAVEILMQYIEDSEDDGTPPAHSTNREQHN